MIDYRIGKRVTLAKGVIPGAFVVIGDDAKIGANVRLAPFVYVAPAVTIGTNVDIGPHAVILADVPDGAWVEAGAVWRGTPKADVVPLPPIQRGRPKRA